MTPLSRDDSVSMSREPGVQRHTRCTCRHVGIVVLAEFDRRVGLGNSNSKREAMAMAMETRLASPVLIHLKSNLFNVRPNYRSFDRWQ